MAIDTRAPIIVTARMMDADNYVIAYECADGSTVGRYEGSVLDSYIYAHWDGPSLCCGPYEIRQDGQLAGALPSGLVPGLRCGRMGVAFQAILSARVRHLARETCVIPLHDALFPGSPWACAAFSLPVGQPEESEGSLNYALFAIDRGVLKVWMHGELRSSPFVHFGRCKPPEVAQVIIRPMIGGIGWFGTAGGWELRCGLDANGAMHLVLPISPHADQHIVWWREETLEEWQGSPVMFEHASVARHEHEARARDYPTADGWESVKDPGSQCRHYRRARSCIWPVQDVAGSLANAQDVMAQSQAWWAREVENG